MGGLIFCRGLLCRCGDFCEWRGGLFGRCGVVGLLLGGGEGFVDGVMECRVDCKELA